jgi:hypothetical protein
MYVVNMIERSQNSRGYKPHIVRELLGVSKERLRYWKKNLDPKPTRTHFSSSDLFAYRILQACIQDLRITPSELKTFDLPCVFEFCQTHELQDMENYLLKLNIETKTISINAESDSFDFRNRKISCLFLEELVKEHILAFLSHGRSETMH